MGYSIFVIAKDENQRDEIHKILANVYNPAKFKCLEFCSSRLTNDPAYGPHDKPIVGFDYSSGINEPERTYIYILLDAICKKFGMTEFHYDDDLLEASDPYREINFPFSKNKMCNKILKKVFGISKKDLKKIRDDVDKIMNS